MGKASFEETMDNFLNAAAQGDVESTDGVSASIICGKRAKIGTGMMQIGIDIDNLPLPVEEEERDIAMSMSQLALTEDDEMPMFTEL